MIFLLPMATEASNDRWVWIASNDEVGYFFDTQSFQDKSVPVIKKEAYSVWIKTQYTEAYGKEMAKEEGFAEAASHSMSKFEFDYNNKTLTSLAYAVYGKNGKILYSDQKTSKSEQIIPDTMGEAIFYTTYSYYVKYYK